MDFVLIVVAFALGAVLFGLLLLLVNIVEGSAPADAVRSASGSARQTVPSA